MQNFCFVELNCSNPEASKKFYKSMFGWSYDKIAMGPMTYNMVKDAECPGIGVGPKPMAEVPDHWLGYVEVPSVKRAIAKAAKLGADVKLAYQPLPNMGAIGVFLDPTGAAIGVWEPEKAPKKAAKKAAKKPAKKAARK
jgi:uncharacterized protein